jgi:hypothetical protein
VWKDAEAAHLVASRIGTARSGGDRRSATMIFVHRSGDKEANAPHCRMRERDYPFTDGTERSLHGIRIAELRRND